MVMKTTAIMLSTGFLMLSCIKLFFVLVLLIHSLLTLDSEGRDSVCEVNPIFAYGHEFSKYLALGLADNWSQVDNFNHII